MYSKVVQLYIHIYVCIIYCIYVCIWYIFFFLRFFSLIGLSQDIEYSSLCYTVGLCCLSILYIYPSCLSILIPNSNQKEILLRMKKMSYIKFYEKKCTRIYRAIWAGGTSALLPCDSTLQSYLIPLGLSPLRIIEIPLPCGVVERMKWDHVCEMLSTVLGLKWSFVMC